MRDYIIMTDSCCDLSQQEVEELDLTVLPLSFTIEGKTLLNTPDHADLSPEEFFKKIAEGADCTTSAVNVGQFTDAMEKVLDEGKDILCICFSSALSTTYQSACIAASDLREKHPGAKIIVIDSSFRDAEGIDERENWNASAAKKASTSTRWRAMSTRSSRARTTGFLSMTSTT